MRRVKSKVRRFMPREHLNTIFSARQFGLALASDIQNAFFNIPPPDTLTYLDANGETVEWEAYDADKFEVWFDQWFSDFIENSDKNE